MASSFLRWRTGGLVEYAQRQVYPLTALDASGRSGAGMTTNLRRSNLRYRK
ncbi:hypothetical protein HMPREF1550_01699 [Actinomyces sp. oral taxon 877 str. F0543]|nr:hypothetical protein HMPREF1550_01699 [Actinomyces sp. oral taxon 877 str. F0543]